MNTATQLQAALEAWRAGADLRARRSRYKNYTYGRQWLDPVKGADGRICTELEEARRQGSRPMTNNVIRQLVKCVTGNFRSRLTGSGVADDGSRPELLDRPTAERNNADELDCRMLEEFLISGCAIQRVVTEHRMGGSGVWIDNVSPDRFFVNRFTDPRGLDIELIGMLHDYSQRETMMRFGHGDDERCRRIAEIYKGAGQVMTTLSLGDRVSAEFYMAPEGRCRVIEVWSLESRRVVKCHDPLSGKMWLAPGDEQNRLESLNAQRHKSGQPPIRLSGRLTARWHCRMYAPTGEVIDEYDSPYRHGLHPFAVKFYPLTDGEVHSFVEDIIDQQRYVNRLITLIDHILSTTAKGVLVFPEESKPDWITWKDVSQSWARTNGVLPLRRGGREPHQIVSANTPTGAYQLLDMQLQLFQQISGVNGALQGRIDEGGSHNSAALYEAQMRNSAVAILDLLESFDAFRRQRNRLVRMS